MDKPTYEALERQIIAQKETIKNLSQDEQQMHQFLDSVPKNVKIIEINHRSNYSHPKNVSVDCDVGFFKDMMSLLLNDETNNLTLI